ncbi:MAG TPA: hypothetical protein VM534_01175 [Thermoanaerobaculia bacterium]|nr:hypothetical protein [Thermoanaerobaculia bacterium]
MTDRKLEQLLHEIPRVTASPTFTGEVMARLEPPVPSNRRTRLAIAAALVLMILTAGGIGYQAREERRLAAMRLERERLVTELAEIRRLTTDPPPAIYLGTDSGTDYLLEWNGPGQPIAPASYRKASTPANLW